MPMTFSIRVDFSKGRITEWYPKASSVQPLLNEDGWIEWNRVQVSKSIEPLPKEGSASHYYAARLTNAWPLASDGENEKLLFYRGLGFFDLDLKPVIETDEVRIRNDGIDTIPVAILFDNHSGKTGYQIVRNLRDPLSIRLSDLTGTTESLRQRLQQELTEAGLYPDEAHAMLETWRDSWFDEGTRVIYILPRANVDTLLPLSIQPAPTQLSRVFVGRMELLSPWMKDEITSALVNGDIAVLKKYGRFLNAFLGQMSRGRAELPMCDGARQLIQAAYERVWQECQRNSCSQ
jgi:hypothetical protein